MAASIHEFSTGVDIAWTTSWITESATPAGRSVPYPPIANISSRGRLDEVASVRSSE